MRLILVVVTSASLAAAAPVVRSPERAARDSFVSARAECAKPGPTLRAFVEPTFAADRLGPRVIDGWLQLDDAQRATFGALADQVLGTEKRMESIAIVCRPHAKIESVFLHAPDMMLLKLRAPSDDECQSLVLAPRDGRWAMTGTWFCGVSNYEREIRRRLGGGDYAKAIAYLEAAAR